MCCVSLAIGAKGVGAMGKIKTPFHVKFHNGEKTPFWGRPGGQKGFYKPSGTILIWMWRNFMWKIVQVDKSCKETFLWNILRKEQNTLILRCEYKDNDW